MFSQLSFVSYNSIILIVTMSSFIINVPLLNAMENDRNVSGPATEENDIQDIYVLGMWPMEGPWSGGQGLIPAALMALEHVNSDPTILPGYRLNMIWNDSKVGC